MRTWRPHFPCARVSAPFPCPRLCRGSWSNTVVLTVRPPLLRMIQIALPFSACAYVMRASNMRLSLAEPVFVSACSLRVHGHIRIITPACLRQPPLVCGSHFVFPRANHLYTDIPHWAHSCVWASAPPHTHGALTHTSVSYLYAYVVCGLNMPMCIPSGNIGDTIGEHSHGW